MDLSYGEEYDVFRSEMRSFLEKHKAESPREREISSQQALDWQALLIEHGYTARTIPKEYGGYGAEPDVLKSRIISEEFANAQVRGGLGGQGVGMLVPTLLELGTEEQKKQFIKPTIQGKMIWCQGYSEPNAGSDLASLKTSGVLDGDVWVVNGQKIWTSTAHIADWIFCLVRTEPQAAKHKGISFLLFKMDTPGIEIRPLVDMTGAHNFNETFFTDVKVPKDQIVGERGQGWFVANSILGHEREGLGDPNTMLTRFNALVDLMKTETINGERLIEHPTYRDRLMKIQGRLMALRFNDMRILSGNINKKKETLPRMIVKLQGTELRHDLEALAIDAMGEVGLSYGEGAYLRNQGSWQYQYMFYLGVIIAGGTSQIQKNIISERGLGMPREPRFETKT